ncbi:MAG: hypothetical protein WDO74_02310 [Pseudomonadota bacterium]
MANPGEPMASQVVGIGKPTKAAAELNGAFKHLMEEHGEVFALVKRLGMRSDELVRRELDGSSHEPGEMDELSAALWEIVQTLERSLTDDAEPSDLADAMAALDAINPGSPEWGPAFLQVSELLEAHVNGEQNDFFSEARRGTLPPGSLLS